MKKSNGKNILRIICGGAVGAANSFFGGGGGMIAVPLLEKTGISEKESHATAILLILPVSLLSFLFYYFRGNYDFSVLIPTAIGVTAGGTLGAKFLCKMSVKSVRVVFAILQLAAGISLIAL